MPTTDSVCLKQTFKSGREGWQPWAVTALLACFTATTQAAILVDTLGGGPKQFNANAAGSNDGSTFTNAQFNLPSGLALDSKGNLYVADRLNGKVRKVTHPGAAETSVTSTFASGLKEPVALLVDGSDSLFVLTYVDGRIRKFNSTGNLLVTNASGLSLPTAMALDANHNFYVTEAGGKVKRVPSDNGAITPITTTTFSSPAGIAILNNGFIVVSESGSHSLRLINPATGQVGLLAGGVGSSGFGDGEGSFARFNSPNQIATAPDGSLIVADRLNHRIRRVETNGVTSTLYGIDSKQWNSQFYPGWFDGDAEVAAVRLPLGVAVSSSGTIFTTEAHYHLLRSAVGAAITGTVGDPGSGGGGTTNGVTVTPPVLSPAFGYYPMGRAISVSAPSSTVFYTTDGTEPTTNSLSVTLENNVGTIPWRESVRDLTSLKVKAFSGTNASVTVSGQAAPLNDIGIPRDFAGGVGSTLSIPIVINLRPGEQLRSLVFRVDVKALNGAPPITSQLKAQAVLGTDFITLKGAALENLPLILNADHYPAIDPGTRGLFVSAVGTNANLFIQNYAVAAMLSVPIPKTATLGQEYEVAVLFPSGTADGAQHSVALNATAPRRIVVEDTCYLVGDTAPGTGYNAGEFGNDILDSADVNNVFYASLGLRQPPLLSDAFDAMDVFPPDGPGYVGGDGKIELIDWQILLARALGLDSARWKRAFSSEGRRISRPESSFISGPSLMAFSSAAPATATEPAPGAVWVSQGTVSATGLTNAQPDTEYSLPVSVMVKPGFQLAGMQFRAVLQGGEGAPSMGPITFVPAPGKQKLINQAGLSPNEVICAWSFVPVPAFNPLLQPGSNYLGKITFRVPAGAQPGHCYTLSFLHSSGAQDLQTPGLLEGVPVCVWVLSPALQPTPVLSEEWKQRFFGSLDTLLSEANADADQDGVPNWQEYLAGTNPTNALSRLELLARHPAAPQPHRNVALKWLSAPGKTYVVESAPSLLSTQWTLVGQSIVGDGTWRELQETNLTQGVRYYRIRVQP